MRIFDGTRYRDMTPEEEAEYLRSIADAPQPEPTLEEQVAELKAQNKMLLECLLEMSEIVYA